jgi:hypothetical protein
MSSPAHLVVSGYFPPPADKKVRVRTYLANRGKITDEERQKFQGQWIAVRWDGLEILAGDADLIALRDRLSNPGIDPEDAVYSQVHGPNEILIEHGSEIEIISNDAVEG